MHGSPPAPNLPAHTANWRTPAVVLVCGCLIAMIGFGPRSAFGFFLTPLSTANGWGREVFALSVAMQTLIYGAAQPFSGAIADRFGTIRVIIAGALLYAAGVYMMAHASSPGMLYLSSGVLIGFGLSGCSFNLVISSFAKLLPESWRSTAFGAGTASGSFGQFLFSPFGVALIDALPLWTMFKCTVWADVSAGGADNQASIGFFVCHGMLLSFFAAPIAPEAISHRRHFPGGNRFIATQLWGMGHH